MRQTDNKSWKEKKEYKLQVNEVDISILFLSAFDCNIKQCRQPEPLEIVSRGERVNIN